MESERFIYEGGSGSRSISWEEAELGEGEAERDDVETESVGVRRGR